MTASSKLRILCLHGFTSNSQVHAHQLRRLISALPEGYEFLFPDAPHQVAIDKQLDLSNPDHQIWQEFVRALSEDVGHRAWWYARDPEGIRKQQGSLEGIEESFDYLGKYLREHGGSVDAVWGFSQGGCLAGMLIALLQPAQFSHPLRRRLHIEDEQFQLKAGVIFAGFRARFEQYDDIYEPHGIDTPVLHVVGERDPLVNSERSEALMRVCKKEDILRFEGGHDIPKGESEAKRIVEFMRKYVGFKGSKGDDGREQASM